MLAARAYGRGTRPLLLIHGNSSCSEIFRKQFTSGLAQRFRVIAFDLPGHGQSSDAPDPERSYTRPGLAEAAGEVLAHCGITETAVLGWSLGGHVGIELLACHPGLRGLMIVGAPPVAVGRMADGFRGAPQSGLAGREFLSTEEAAAFADAMLGTAPDPFLVRAIERTDRRFRKRLFEAARKGLGVDQRSTVERSPVPLAVVNGADDRLVHLDYFDTLAYANLWDGRCHRLPGGGHAPFWNAAESFNALLERFLEDVYAAS